MLVLRKTALSWLFAVSRPMRSEAAAASIPMPEAIAAASLASAGVSPNSIASSLESLTDGFVRSVKIKTARPPLNVSLPSAVTGIASISSQGASARLITTWFSAGVLAGRCRQDRCD